MWFRIFLTSIFFLILNGCDNQIQIIDKPVKIYTYVIGWGKKFYVTVSKTKLFTGKTLFFDLMGISNDD